MGKLKLCVLKIICITIALITSIVVYPVCIILSIISSDTIDKPQTFFKSWEETIEVAFVGMIASVVYLIQGRKNDG